MPLTPVVKLPDTIGAGQLTDYNNYYPGKPLIAWVTWADYNNNSYYAFNYNNPLIAGYEVVIKKEDGSVFFSVNDWKFHSTWFFLFDDPIRLTMQTGGNFYCAFPVEVGNYTAILKVHGTDGTVLETAPMPFTVTAPVPPPAPTTTTMVKAQAKKK